MVLILAIGSDKLLRKSCSADHVEVNMHNGLASAFAAVVDRSVSIAYASDLSYFSDGLGDLCGIKSSLRICSQFVHVAEMLLGNNKNVHGCYGINILEAVYMIVLIYFC